MHKYVWLRRALAIAIVTAAVFGGTIDSRYGGATAASTPSATPADATIARVPNPPLNTDLISLPGDLRAVAVPAPPNLGEYVKDPALAIAIGKALFWDMQVGSDGVQACASSHFRAG